MIASVAKSLLLLFMAANGDERLAFECPPWATNHWRGVLGLSPVGAKEDEDQDSMDLDGSPTSSPVASAADGFVFSSSAITTFTEARRQCITDPRTLKLAGGFMQRFWEQTRKDMDRNKPFSYTFDSLPKDQGKVNDPSWPGFGEFRNLALAMVNRRDGVVERVDAIMARLGFLPTDKWKDDRDVNRSLPQRQIKDEYQIPIPLESTRLDNTALQAEVARDIFGGDAVSKRGIVLPGYQPTIKALLYRRYENLARKLRTTQKKSGVARANLDKSLEKARASHAAKDLHDAAKNLVAWRRIALKSLEHDEPEFLSREKLLKGLWEEVGFPAQGVSGKVALNPKAKNKSIIPTDEEMQMAYQYYLEHYCNGLGSIDDPDAYEAPLFINRVHGLVDEDADIGVEFYKDWTKESLWESMGVPGATQFAFAEPGSHAKGKGTASKDPATPYWHQLVGVHRILESIWTAHLGERPFPTLLLDDVGLGKTIQIIGVFSMIRHYYEQQALASGKEASGPKFAEVNGTPYFVGLEEIPNLPSIVISPRTLSDQWVEQWAKFTHHGAFSIVRYSVDQGPLENFCTDPNGAYMKAAGADGKRASSVIIVADLSAVAAEAKRCLDVPELSPKSKEGQLVEAKGDVPKFKTGVDTTGSLMTMRFRAAAVDECHNLRNSNHAQRGTQVLTHNAHVVIGATATMIFTSLWDALAQARIMRFEPVLGEAGVRLCERMTESMQDRAKDWLHNSAQFIKNAISRETRAAASETGVSAESPLFVKLQEQIKSKYENAEQVKILESTHVSQNALKMLRKVLRPIIVRRTGDSVDNKGNPILGLPPVKRLTAWSPMRTEEHRTQQEINQEHQQRKKSGAKKGKQDSAAIKWHNFLMSQKDAAVHVLIYQLKKLEEEKRKQAGVDKADATAANNALGKSLAKTITADWNESNINSKASTRMLKVDEIVEHFWAGNPAPIVFNEDGTQDFTALVEEPLPSKDPRKFLIYVAYHTHRDLLADMFRIKKRGYVCYDGSMPIPKRQAAVDKFNNDPSCRIMIISNVGSAGLNLVAASVVIVLSNVWSGLEKDQIFGRVVRPGQKRDVLLYDVVAPGGIDLALLGYSEKKSTLSEQLLMSQAALERIYSDVTAPEEDYDNGMDADQDEHAKVKTTKVLSRKRKQLDEPDQDESEGSTSESPPKRTKSSSSKRDAPAKVRRKVTQAESSTVQPVSKKANPNVAPNIDLVNLGLGKESINNTQVETHQAQLPTQQVSKRAVSQLPGELEDVRGALFEKQGTVHSKITAMPTPKPRTKFKPPPAAVSVVPLGSGDQTSSQPGASVTNVGSIGQQVQQLKPPAKTTELPEVARIVEQNGKGPASVSQTASTAPRPKRKFKPPPRQASVSHAAGSSMTSHAPIAVEPDDVLPMEHCGPVSLEGVTPASQTRDGIRAQGTASIQLAVPLPSNDTQSGAAQPPKAPVIGSNVMQVSGGQGGDRANKADSKATGAGPTTEKIAKPKRRFKPPPTVAGPSSGSYGVLAVGLTPSNQRSPAGPSEGTHLTEQQLAVTSRDCHFPAALGSMEPAPEKTPVPSLQDKSAGSSQTQPVPPSIPLHRPMAPSNSPIPASKPEVKSSISGARAIKPVSRKRRGGTLPQSTVVHGTTGGMSDSEDSDNSINDRLLEGLRKLGVDTEALMLEAPRVPTKFSQTDTGRALGLQVADNERLHQETEEHRESQQSLGDAQLESRAQTPDSAVHSTAKGTSESEDPGQSTDEDLLERKRHLRLQVQAIKLAGPMVRTTSSQPAARRPFQLQVAGPADKELFERLRQGTEARRRSQLRRLDAQRTESRTQSQRSAAHGTAGSTSKPQDPGRSTDESLTERQRKFRLQLEAIMRAGPMVGTTSSQLVTGRTPGLQDAEPATKRLFEPRRRQTKERRESQQPLCDEQRVEPRTQPQHAPVHGMAGGASELLDPDESLNEQLEVAARISEGPRSGTASSQPATGHAFGLNDAGPVKKGLFERLRQENKERREKQQRLLDEHLLAHQVNNVRSQKRTRIESGPVSTEVPGKSRKVNRQPSSTAKGEVSWLSERREGASQSKVVRHPATVSSKDGETLKRGL